MKLLPQLSKPVSQARLDQNLNGKKANLNNNNMLIVGTGGLGKEVLSFMLGSDFPAEKLLFYDENPNAAEMLYGRFRVLKTEEDLTKHFQKDADFIVGIGHPRIREKLVIKMEKIGGRYANAIFRGSYVFHYNETPEGIIIQPGVGISHNVSFGRGCAIHINSTIGHSAKIGKFVNVGPNVSIIGPVEIGDYAYIAAQSVILPNVKIGNNAIVSAGSIVKNDIPDFGSV